MESDNPMTMWNVALQLESTAALGMSRCQRFHLPGAALPFRVTVVACDTFADAFAVRVHDEIGKRLSRMGGVSTTCGPARDMTCHAWNEPSSRHFLVLIVGAAPLDVSFQARANQWMKAAKARVTVVPALVAPLTPAQVFGTGTASGLSQLQFPTWGNRPDILAGQILDLAAIDHRPGVFISYLRKEASAAAEDLHDGLVRIGFRVYLDRFSGTPGRHFPSELAEAMSSYGLVLLLETPGLLSSRWTLWECAFARRYRLGPIALNFSGAGHLPRVTQRQIISGVNPMTRLPKGVLQSLVDFVRAEHAGVAVGRRAFYESLVQTAARSKGGHAEDVGEGVLEVRSSAGIARGYVLPCGAPGGVRHVRRLVNVRAGGPLDAVLAGEHHHLHPADRSDLVWLANRDNVGLTGSASMFRRVQNLL